jgi:cobalt-zinc-cadmium efflux system protein
LEVLADMLGSVGVVAAGLVQATTGWPYADPIIAAGIGLLVLPRTYRLMRAALRILMEVAPPGVDVLAAQQRLLDLPGVTEVHDLHIWTVTDGIESATAHVVVAADADWHEVLDASVMTVEFRYRRRTARRADLSGWVAELRVPSPEQGDVLAVASRASHCSQWLHRLRPVRSA